MAVMAAEWSMDMKHKKAVAVMSGVVIALGGVYAGAKEANAAEKNVLENSDVINADKMNSDELNYDINNKVMVNSEDGAVILAKGAEVAEDTEDSALKKDSAEKKSLEKEETVYVRMTPQGEKSDVIVSDWIKNFAKAGEIADESSLTDITNVKGEEAFSQNGESVTWQAAGNDIYYQGKTDKELPFAIKVTYKLDGKEVKVSDLDGKSGKLEMTYEYSKTEDNDVIFAVAMGTILDGNKFHHVSIDNGRVLSDGDKYIIAGFAVPGLSDKIGNKDNNETIAEIKDALTTSVTITADVENFEMPTVYHFASSDLLGSLGLDDVDTSKISELKDGINQLVTATDDIYDGSVKLSDGLSDLNDGTIEYTDGVRTYVDGVNEYSTGVETLTNGVSEYLTGADSYVAGADQYIDGVNELTKGLGEYTGGVSQYVAGVNEYLDGTGKVTD